MPAPWKKSYAQPTQHIKKERHHFANKGSYIQSYGFSNCLVQIWELDHKESWAPKNWCFWTVVLEKTLQSPLDCKETQPVNPKGNQPWTFIRKTDAEAPILRPPEVNSWLIGKDPNAGKDRRQRRRGWQSRRGWDGWMETPIQWTWVSANSRESHGSLVCCSSWSHKESDKTDRLNDIIINREFFPVMAGRQRF